MSRARLNNRLDRPVDGAYDHVLGPADAQITLVEYGSYACPYCRAANEQIAKVRDQFGDRLRYVFRHRPLTGSDIARRAAELAERADDSGAVLACPCRADDPLGDPDRGRSRRRRRRSGPGARRPRGSRGGRPGARRRGLHADERSARASGVMFTPTFFINGRRYDGPWDESSLADAMLGSLGHRVRSAALDFASWAPVDRRAAAARDGSRGGADQLRAGARLRRALAAGRSASRSATPAFGMSLLHWINDGLLTIFFLVVGLEIKREFTVGHLASRRSAALPDRRGDRRHGGAGAAVSRW